MPKKQRAPRPKHEHQWYAISFDARTREPVLWACGVYWWCTATATRQLKGRGKQRKLTKPSPIIPVPTRGLWQVTDKQPAPEVS